MSQQTLPYRLVVTSGPTQEWLDPVRFVSNSSSGRTGWHLASQAIAKEYFSEVVYICGPVNAPYKQVEKCINVSVESTQEMCDAVHKYVCDNCILIMSAAPTDYYLPNISQHKIKKTNQSKKLVLVFEPTIDILKSLIPIASQYSNFYRVGFAAETQNVIKHAKVKLEEKQLFWICANQVYKNVSGFGDIDNTLSIIDKQGNINSYGPASKANIADFLLERIIHQLVIPKNADAVSLKK